MTAASVTGIGQGSADKMNKGSEHTTLGVDHLIGPRVVDCGTVVLTSGTPSSANVKFAVALSSATGYYVQLTPVGATAAIAAAGACTSAVATTGFTVTGANSVSTTINWVVFKI